MDDGIQARKLEKTLRELRADRDVRHRVARRLAGWKPGRVRRGCQSAPALWKKPVVVSQGDVAASGGYWLSMCSNQSFQPTTVTGSIGVISGWVWDKGLGEKVGWRETCRSGRARRPSSSRAVPPGADSAPRGERRERNPRRDEDAVCRLRRCGAKYRSMPKDKVEELAQDAWTGVATERLGRSHRRSADAIQLAREQQDRPKTKSTWSSRCARALPISLCAAALQSPTAIAAVATFDAFEALAARELLDATNRSGATEDSISVDYDLTYLRQLIRNNGRGLCLLPPDFLPRESGR
jgi:hypothetical protein